MAEYKEIHGTKIRNYTTNPDNPITGEVWYNDTDNVLKFQFPNTTSAWSTGGTLNTARESLAGAGIQTAALAFGGESPPSTGATELYNGSNWTELNDLSTVRYGLAGVGLYTAALAFGGNTGPGAVTESFNGTNWTEVNDLNTARNILTGIGIQTSALAVGGYTTTRVANTETWNGTNWTEVNDMNTAKMRLGGNIGVDSTAGLAYGGSEPGGVTANTEQWNGTNWTEVNNLNTGRDSPRGGGTITAGVAFGGETGGGAPGFTGKTELWDGTSWTEVADMSTGRPSHASAGIQTAALAFGGQPTPGNGALTEEFTGGVPVGAWATGGGLNTARSKIGGTASSRDSSLAAGGQTPTRVANTESYNGTNWTEVNDLNTVKSTNSAAGTTTAAITMGGRSPSSVAITQTEIWNGTNWTEVNDLNTARREISGSTAGTYTAGIITAGGGSPTPSRIADTELWNGTNWTEVNNLNLARNRTAQVGIQTAALCFGGATTTFVANNESWNGTNWTEVNDLGTARYGLSGAGTSTSALGFGGYQYQINPSAPHAVALTEDWNGSSWTEVADLNVKRDNLTGNGTSSSAIAVGGTTSAGTQSATEEWNSISNTTKTVSTD